MADTQTNTVALPPKHIPRSEERETNSGTEHYDLKPMLGFRDESFAYFIEAKCPLCDAQLMYCRNLTSRIDNCGFQNYSIECRECGSMLAGITDPYDGTLLLSQLQAS